MHSKVRSTVPGVRRSFAPSATLERTPVDYGLTTNKDVIQAQRLERLGLDMNAQARHSSVNCFKNLDQVSEDDLFSSTYKEKDIKD